MTGCSCSRLGHKLKDLEAAGVRTDERAAEGRRSDRLVNRQGQPARRWRPVL